MSSEYRSPWGETYRPAPQKHEPERAPARTMRWLTIAIGLLFLVFLAIAAYFYLFSRQGPSVGIEFLRPPQVFLGEQFELGVSISNLSDTVLKNVRLSLYLPEGVYLIGEKQSQRVVERMVGDLGPGSVRPEPFSLIATGGGQALKRVAAKVSYLGGTGRAEFESSSEVDFVVGESAINLTAAAPESVFAGQDFEIVVSYANNTAKEFKNVRFKMDYPPSYVFRRSSVAPEDAANNSWNLGNLAPGSSGSITITGNILGAEGSFFGLTASLYADFLGSSYKIDSEEISLKIASAPLSVAILVNDSKDYVSRAGDDLIYTITYKNNSSVAMRDVIIRARLLGAMFDIQTLSANAAFDSLTNTLTWLGANTPELLNIAPGQSGSVSFKIRTKKIFPIRQLSDKNFTVKVQAQIESGTLPPGTVAEKTISLAEIENKVAGELLVEAKAFWRDAASGILNQGPYPLRANQATEITVHWILRSSATDLNDVAVSAFLQSGARLTGKIKSNVSSMPTVNPGSGLVSWNVGSIPAAKGVLSEPIEAVFQIEVIPATTQIGDKIVIMGETRAQGVDAFTGARLESRASPLTSDLPHDTTITANDRRIQP